MQLRDSEGSEVHPAAMDWEPKRRTAVWFNREFFLFVTSPVSYEEIILRCLFQELQVIKKKLCKNSFISAFLTHLLRTNCNHQYCRLVYAWMILFAQIVSSCVSYQRFRLKMRDRWSSIWPAILIPIHSPWWHIDHTCLIIEILVSWVRECTNICTWMSIMVSLVG